ncbi:hypothetical protein HZH66_009908 [Vespula vulgaris]|uniref:Uncharacterized protein n=1 Tax=Vespula vulgaris TaxID=7454 RepID=A0A834JNU2_VESVU|nr:hypothetical protein HZH66_009908 [Vespula vulgaris]
MSFSLSLFFSFPFFTFHSSVNLYKTRRSIYSLGSLLRIKLYASSLRMFDPDDIVEINVEFSLLTLIFVVDSSMLIL